jgi:hypothetical protein
LRESKPLCGFDLNTPEWSLGLCPKLRKPKRCAFWFPLRGPHGGSHLVFQKSNISRPGYPADFQPRGGELWRSTVGFQGYSVIYSIKQDNFDCQIAQIPGKVLTKNPEQEEFPM